MADGDVKQCLAVGGRALPLPGDRATRRATLEVEALRIQKGCLSRKKRSPHFLPFNVADGFVAPGAAGEEKD